LGEAHRKRPRVEGNALLCIAKPSDPCFGFASPSLNYVNPVVKIITKVVSKVLFYLREGECGGVKNASRFLT